jgi:glycosyltransferase involved in cell wall biosynthesis
MTHPETPTTPPARVAVCVATYRRREGVRTLLASLDAVDLAPIPAELTIVIVDNYPDAPAFENGDEAARASRWPVIYLHEPRRGIVAARNRCLSAVPETAEFVAFVDDDESVTPGWLQAMLGTFEETGATAVQGPMVPRYEAEPPAWLVELGVFRIGPFVQGERLHSAATGNSMIRAGFLREHRLRFDPRFNESGGEDEEFYTRLREAGGRIHAAAGADVYDIVPAQRMTLRWYLRRRFRMGNTLGRIALMHGQGRARRAVKGVLAIGYGVVVAAFLGFGSRSRAIDALGQVARGLGMFAAFLRLGFSEYSDASVSSDRTEGGAS